jgi:Holliday junction resolvase RusA-like endonuclease
MTFKPIRLELPILAVAKGRARFTKSGHAYTPEKTRSFEAELRWHWEKSGHSMIPRWPTALTVVCYLPRPKKPEFEFPIARPDVDNFGKSIMDGLNGFAWKDDAQIVDLDTCKRYAESTPKIIIIIEPMEAA